MKRWALHFLLLKTVHITDINQDPVIGITAATEVIVVMVVIEIHTAIGSGEVTIVDITEIIPVVLSTIHKGNKNKQAPSCLYLSVDFFRSACDSTHTQRHSNRNREDIP